jgi:hypothetical protein
MAIARSRRWRRFRRKMRDAVTFAHPAVKFALLAILIVVTIAFVVYALKVT